MQGLGGGKNKDLAQEGPFFTRRWYQRRDCDTPNFAQIRSGVFLGVPSRNSQFWGFCDMKSRNCINNFVY